MPNERFVIDFIARGAGNVNRQLKAVQGSFSSLARTTRTVAARFGVGGIIGSITGGLSATSVIASAKGVDQLARSAKKLGTSLPELQKFELVAAKTGTTLDKITPSILDFGGKLGDAIGALREGKNIESLEALRRLGYSDAQIRNLGKGGPGSSFNEAAARRAGIDSGRIAAARSRGRPSGANDAVDKVIQEFATASIMDAFIDVMKRARGRQGPEQLSILANLFSDEGASQLLGIVQEKGGFDQLMRDAAKSIGSNRLTGRDVRTGQEGQDAFAELMSDLNNTLRKISTDPAITEGLKQVSSAVDEFIEAVGGGAGIAQIMRDVVQGLNSDLTTLRSLIPSSQFNPRAAGESAGQATREFIGNAYEGSLAQRVIHSIGQDFANMLKQLTATAR